MCLAGEGSDGDALNPNPNGAVLFPHPAITDLGVREQTPGTHSRTLRTGMGSEIARTSSDASPFVRHTAVLGGVT